MTTPMQLQYKPTKLSRKWRNSFTVMNLTEVGQASAKQLAIQENWYSYRWIPL